MAVPPSSPSAALNGWPAAARMARRAGSDTAPSAPRRGVLASITSAPPTPAARASRASATLTSSRIGALLPPAAPGRLGFHSRDGKRTGGGGGADTAGADILTGGGRRLSGTERLDRLVAVDLRGTVLASWTAVALMREQPPGGVILNMSWDHVLTGAMRGEYSQVFCAVKGGVYSFSRALAQSAAPHIRVNVLGPGWVETAYGRELDDAVKRRITESIPLKRWATPQDVAHAAVYLASDAAGYITGQMLLINGGAIM